MVCCTSRSKGKSHINRAVDDLAMRGLLLKVWRKLVSFKSVPPFEVFTYIFSKVNSNIVRKYLGSCGARFYVSPGSTIRGGYNIHLGRDFYAGRGFWIECVSTHQGIRYFPEIRIGDNFSASNYVHIGAVGKITIGNNVLIGSKVIIIDHSHGSYSGDLQSSPDSPPVFRRLGNKEKAINICDNVWLCDGVTILPGVEIGSGSIVSANSVVSDDVPAFTIVAGIPARIIKRYDPTSRKWMRC